MILSWLYDVVKLVPFLWRIFNFELEEKLDHHSDVKFHGDSDGNGFKVQKLKDNTLIDLN